MNGYTYCPCLPFETLIKIENAYQEKVSSQEAKNGPQGS
jgi:hypothetical protein